jgi:hypothetical protein
MKETTLSKITASVRVAKGMAERVLAASVMDQKFTAFDHAFAGAL